jgi:hypothetical protein
MDAAHRIANAFISLAAAQHQPVTKVSCIAIEDEVENRTRFRLSFFLSGEENHLRFLVDNETFDKEVGGIISGIPLMSFR